MTPGYGAGIVNFQEKFALAEDREIVLLDLIPGTDDYYYYHCLHYQNTDRLDEADTLIETWIERHKRTERVREIQHRQALLRYEGDPEGSLEYIRRELGLHFNHEREVVDRKPGLPTALDPSRISRETLTQRALRRHPETVQGFEDASFDWLITQDLDERRRRDLLQRLQRPYFENLVELIAADIKWERSGGFGTIPLHGALLRDQLDELLRRIPELLNQTNFVNIYLTKLRPNPDVDWPRDDEAREAHLDDLEEFVMSLNPSHNSLKAHVLYQRLLHERAMGNFDKERFMQYIQLPRTAVYMNPGYVQQNSRRRFRANLNQDFQFYTLLPIVGNDEPLIRSYLRHFFVEENAYSLYETYLSDDYLKEVFAETKVLYGLGDMEQWYSWLSPAKYQALKDRIDLTFDYANPKHFAVDDEVSLDVWVKNISTLIIKVYEINTQNYYRKHGREVNTDIDLDGLVAHFEETATYEEPPLRLVKRRYSFPNLKDPGVYVIELIGNGKSSRALIRKGRLSYLERSSVAGHVFTVLNEANEVVKDGAIWLAGREYAADEDGTIAVPYTNEPGRQSIILSQGSFSSLDSFSHMPENYTLHAGIHVDRESLRAGSTAKVAIRPALYLNDMPAPLDILEDVVLVISSTNRDGTSTSKEIRDPELDIASLYEYEFGVPTELAGLSFVLKAKVENLSQSKKVDLAASKTFSINQVDTSDKIEVLHLSRMAGQYVLELLGKTGEAKADRGVHITCKHGDFKDRINLPLQTDGNGRIQLGNLDGITSLSAQGPDGVDLSWRMLQGRHNYPGKVHGAVGQAIQIVHMGDSEEALRNELSLLETRQGQFVADYFDALAIEDGFISINGLPAGDYSLFLKSTNRRIYISVTDGEREGRHILSEFRRLKSLNPNPLQITSVEPEASTITVQLANVARSARVHVAATRFMPAHSFFDNIVAGALPEPTIAMVPRTESAFISGRNIGDEYQYILDRKYAGVFAGNMLDRPGLLISPWAIATTETERQDAAQGEPPAAASAPPQPQSISAKSRRSARGSVDPGGFANVDFLSGDAVVLLNLEPDESGVVYIDRNALNGRQHVHIVATDAASTVYREISLAEDHLPFRDLRMANGLDPESHATEQKQISFVAGESEFVIEDATTAQFEIYDTLQKVYALYTTLNQHPALLEFNALMRWPSLANEEQRTFYSKYACHELNFFLYTKDPDFFEAVVRPFIANKQDKTFLDHWLLEAPMDDYMEPWAYSQLNIVERILLAERMEGEDAITARHVTDLYNLIPPNIDRFNHLFKTALQGRSLDTRRYAGLAAQESMTASRGISGGVAFDDGGFGTRVSDGVRAGRGGGGFGGGGRQQISDMPTRRVLSEDDADRLKGLGYLGDERAEKRKPTLLAISRAAAEYEIANGEAALDMNGDGLVEELNFLASDDLARRGEMRQLYQKLDTTEEWVENNYYHVPIEQQNANLITVNAFWRDYAARDSGVPFISTHLAEATGNFSEMMFALAVLDLPFEAAEHETAIDEQSLTMTSSSPLVVFHKEIRAIEAAGVETPILISQNFFRHGDRYIQRDNERIDKFVRDEFLTQVVYGCQVAVTNPSSSRQKLEVLIQVPQGAIPVANGKFTKGINLNLEPYNTLTVEYFFYFPAPGTFTHYPVHASKNGELIAFADAMVMEAVLTPSTIDTTSWDYISQNGSPEQVIDYLRGNNLHRIPLGRIAWRMKDKAYFDLVTGLLKKRHVYDDTLWSYALRHDARDELREYLQHRSDFVIRCGAYIDTPILTIDPVIRKSYQHMEYKPLVNARAHQLGGTRTILNNRFAQQYNRLTNVLRYRPGLGAGDKMAVTYYMLLQDRIEEALAFYGQVDKEALGADLQYDYLGAYLAFYQEDIDTARAIADRYTGYPVERWAKLFDNVRSQLDEIDGVATTVIDEESQAQRQTQLASTEPSFEFAVEAKQVTLSYQNIAECQVNYYLMDIELLFSRNPFVQQYADHFSTIRPNETQALTLEPDGVKHIFELPARFHSSNVMVEIEAAGVKKSQTYYANALTTQIIETYGQLKVTHNQTGNSLSKVYVKVFARMKDGQVRFYKDGYTDLRGRFDYASLSTGDLDAVNTFSLLVLSEDHGAAVREAAPPKR
jgi:hypothetical protein